ncbi:HNH endonuclease signature motif containing protein [Granulicella cerasi]|uniref:HNH endonuclease signature motif containing protein n=1 Tax=Granulicella cerasi TaxID=741063 RepID=A0ABW1Z645_9BACT|nr:HNH endonuclease signature motif containing protein [Granulicella cerasi]
MKYPAYRKITRKIEQLFRSITRTEDGCWLWNKSKLTNGYGMASFESKPITVHRLSYRLFRGEIPEGAYVLHSCGNRSCLNPDHLRCGSAAMNMQDRMDSPLGWRAGSRGKGVSPEEHAEIFAMFDAGHSAYKISKSPLSTGRVVTESQLSFMRRNRKLIETTDADKRKRCPKPLKPRRPNSVVTIIHTNALTA